MRKAAGLEGKMTYDPCISRQTPIYMKRPDVLKAIHADTHPNPNWPRDRPGWRYGKDVVYRSTALPQVNLSFAPLPSVQTCTPTLCSRAGK